MARLSSRRTPRPSGRGALHVDRLVDLRPVPLPPSYRSYGDVASTPAEVAVAVLHGTPQYGPPQTLAIQESPVGHWPLAEQSVCDDAGKFQQMCAPSVVKWQKQLGLSAQLKMSPRHTEVSVHPTHRRRPVRSFGPHCPEQQLACSRQIVPPPVQVRASARPSSVKASAPATNPPINRRRLPG